MSLDPAISRIKGLLQQATHDPDLSTSQRMQITETLRGLSNLPSAQSTQSNSGGPSLTSVALAAPVALAGITVSVVAILTILCAITAAILLFLIWNRYADQIQATIMMMVRSLVQEIAEMRRRVEAAHQNMPNISCDPQFTAWVAALNAVAMRLNGPAFSRGLNPASLRAIAPLLQEAAIAMQAYLACIGTAEAARLIDTFLGGGGRLTQMLRRMIEALRGPVS